jgi:prepilin-type N-terminal cleavage/methylation domain-containing protein
MRLCNHQGFTLLELLIVITILAFMTTLVGVNLQGRERTDLDSVARFLVTDLRYLRSIAMANNIDTQMVFDLSANSYRSKRAKIERNLPQGLTVRLTLDVRDTGKRSGSIVFYPDGSSRSWR